MYIISFAVSIAVITSLRIDISFEFLLDTDLAILILIPAAGAGKRLLISPGSALFSLQRSTKLAVTSATIGPVNFTETSCPIN